MFTRKPKRVAFGKSQTAFGKTKRVIANKMSVATITVYAKMMSGDLIPLQVNTPIRRLDFYVQLFGALPASLKPQDYYQLVLLEEEGVEEGVEEGDEKKGDEDYLFLQEDDILPLLIAEPYSITIAYICSAWFLSENDYRRTHYQRYHLEIHNGHENVYYKPLYLTPFHLQNQEDTVIFPITPEFVIRQDEDDPELENFRIPCAPRAFQTPHTSPFHVPLHRLLDDFDCSPIIRRRLTDLLRVRWELEQAYQTGEYDAYDQESEDEDEDRHEDEE